MSTPSLLNIPYRLKAGTLYSQLPETGAGDFTVTRTTSVANQSTRINSLGNIELVADNVPRLDYPLGGAVNGCPALLVEPSAQNAFIESQTLFASPHFVQGLTIAGYTNAATSPDGSVTAEKFVPDASGVHGIANGSLLAITSGTTYTLSLFVKSDGGPYNLISLTFDSSAAWGATKNCIFNASNGTNFAVPSGATMTSENYGNGWYRIRATLTAVGTVAATTFQYRIYVADASGNLSWLAPSGNTNGVFCWGAQLETGSVPTSYIPTTTAAVTRSAEQIRRANVSSLIGQTEGTIYLEVEAPTANNDVVVIQRQTLGTSLLSGDYIMLQKTSTNLYRFIVVVGGSISFSITQSAPPTTSFVKIAMAYRGSSPASSAFFINGTQVGSDNTTTFSFPPSIQNIEFVGNQLVGAQTIRLRAFAIYPNRIPNTAAPGVLSLATLTTP